MEFQIADIERAANYWRAAEGPHDGVSLGPTAARIAAVYGVMIYERAERIDAAKIDRATAEAIGFAIRQQELPL